MSNINLKYCSPLKIDFYTIDHDKEPPCREKIHPRTTIVGTITSNIYYPISTYISLSWVPRDGTGCHLGCYF